MLKLHRFRSNSARSNSASNQKSR